MSGVAVVIPAYNEAATARDVVERALRQVPRVIVVDDGSTDGTGERLAGLGATVLRNARNAGKAASLERGMRLALDEGADAVVTLDADGQHRPEDIPRLLAAFCGEPRPVVTGSRLHESSRIPVQRYLAIRFANFWIGRAAGQRLEDSQCGLRVYPAALLRSVRLGRARSAGFVFESEILIEAGRRGVPIVAVPVPAIYAPGARRSHFRPLADVALIARMVAAKLIG